MFCHCFRLLALALHKTRKEVVGKYVITMTRRLLLAFSLLVTACLFFASCSLGGKRGNKKKLPASIGQPTPMVSDMLEFTLKKWRFYGSLLLKSSTFVAVITKVIDNGVKV